MSSHHRRRNYYGPRHSLCNGRRASATSYVLSETRQSPPSLLGNPAKSLPRRQSLCDIEGTSVSLGKVRRGSVRTWNPIRATTVRQSPGTASDGEQTRERPKEEDESRKAVQRHTTACCKTRPNTLLIQFLAWTALSKTKKTRWVRVAQEYYPNSAGFKLQSLSMPILEYVQWLCPPSLAVDSARLFRIHSRLLIFIRCGCCGISL